jgi:hypothetical protein
MDNHTLSTLLSVLLNRSTIKYFGVLTDSKILSDYSPLTPSCYIIYTSNHYYCVYLSRDRFGRLTAEFFCSLGNNPLISYNLHIRGLYSYKYNRKLVQGPKSVLCSIFCLYFAFKKSRGFIFESIIHRFTDNYQTNDQLLCKFYNKIRKPTSTVAKFRNCTSKP